MTSFVKAVRFVCVALAALCVQMTNAAETPPQGNLLIAGGAVRPDNTIIWERLVQLAGGKGARIAVMPSAAGNPERSGANLVATLNKFGASAFAVPVAVRLKTTDYKVAAEDEALARSIREAGGVYFAGGDQGLITKALVRPDGSRTAVLQAIWDVYNKGGVIGGSSAGAAIMSSTMYYEAKTVIGTLAAGVNDGRELAPGLGFVGTDVFVDQHLLARGRFARMLPAMLKKNYKLGLGIDENTAMVINAKREVEIIGYQGALLLDLTQARTNGDIKEFNLTNARISYLDRGDRYNLITGQYTPSADKVNGKLDPANPFLNEQVYSADALGHNTILVMMEKLINNARSEAIGIATAAPGEPREELGFEFKLTRDASSVGYESATTDAYTILNLRLDVRPLQITRPWYR
ncbi:cyanophycinase [Duganella sp. SG902]|uniref:cyanophycinase n=1 Tax=Duganella sp. SG902 TaxID=2587016 RepID=UPI00159E8E1B|nr:cyanophycinase [Duganella sp. SG902]NVM78237.1 cyanophycinase [Duganella sp. SG902]